MYIYMYVRAHVRTYMSDISNVLMKGTKVLTLGAGVSYTHEIHVYACAVLLLVGWSILQLLVAHQLAESQSLACYSNR